MFEVTRKSLLDGLVEGVADDSHASRIWLISGERGIGKTYVAQQLYRKLAEQQSSPAFWPVDLLSGQGEKLEQDRHLVRPHLVEIPPGAAPAFVWIGVSCERAGDGLAFDSLGAASSQVRRLQVAIESALGRDLSGKARGILVDLLEVAATFVPVADKQAATALGLAFAARSATSAYRGLLEMGDESADLRAEGGGWEVGAVRPDRKTISGYSKLLGDLTGKLGLPTVLVVDDLQHADPSLLCLLEGLVAAAPRRLTVVCTAEEAALQTQRASPERTAELAAWLADCAPEVEQVRLGPLSEAAMRGIVQQRAPKTAYETTTALVQRAAGNPYRLRLLLDSPRGQPREGRVRLTARDVMDFPDRVESVHRQSWLDLQPSTRRLLALAAMQGRTVSRRILEATAARLGDTATAEEIEIAGNTQWLVESNAEAVAFPDQARHSVAIAEAMATDTLDEDERRCAGEYALDLAVDESLSRWGAEPDRDAIAGSRQLVPCLEAVANLAGAYRTERASDVASLTRGFGVYLIRHGQLWLAADRARAVGRRLGVETGEARSLGVDLDIQAAEWLSDSGLQREALERIRDLRAHWPAEVLDERITGRELDFVEGRTLMRLGKHSDGTRLLGALAEDPDDADGLGEKSASLLGDSALNAGDVSSAAASLLRRYQTRMKRDSSAWWRDTETCAALRNAIAERGLTTVNAARVAIGTPAGAAGEIFLQKMAVTGHQGLLDSAIAIGDDVVAGMESVDLYARNTITAISDRAIYLSRAGYWARALAEQERALELYDRQWKGPSRNQLVTRQNRAETLSRMGSHELAITALAELYDDAAAELGTEHPVSLDVRMSSARALMRAGEVAAGKSRFGEALREIETALGEDHPEVPPYRLLWRTMCENEAAIAVMVDDSRSSEMVEIDRRRLAMYRKAQAEDWKLLFGSAGLGMRFKRRVLERTIAKLMS